MVNLSQKKPELDSVSGPQERALPRLNRYGIKALIASLILVAGSFTIAYLYGSGRLDNFNFKTIVKDCKPREINTDRTELKSKVETYVVAQKGTIHVSMYEFDSKAGFNIKETNKWDAASTAKVPILLTLYKKIETGEIKKDELLTVTAGDKAAGTGYFIGLPNGTKKTVAATTEAMIKASDNTATNMILRRLGGGSFGRGREAAQAYADSLGAAGTVMVENEITTADLSLYLQKLYRHETTTAELSEEMLGLLTQDEKMDASFKSRLFAGLPEGVRLAHKIGSQTNAISDAGIIFLENKNYVLVVAVINGGWIEADKKIADISKIVYEYEAAREAAGGLDCNDKVF